MTAYASGQWNPHRMPNLRWYVIGTLSSHKHRSVHMRYYSGKVDVNFLIIDRKDEPTAVLDTRMDWWFTKNRSGSICRTLLLCSFVHRGALHRNGQTVRQ